ncbi:hypothetical protein COX74_01645 [bacterium (Candidatus Gribaldobacteria) CG_4_10_14_0_2_um_filter_41_16]|uniref:Uncharacterized protein n=4 Tax=Candidatus Gribaldobacteria TaxID=2798536 RepID=A0A2M7VIJ3_9BACT|nr:MAG: hypothetical protein AUJ36_03560 [Parcubacteria group bacterium CG1_02_41_26]PIR91817.1 MAG: hypothetical protein COU03_00135 [bacterium (Candidatus Gribaldobacteria) CG10_big_fil_rev_8_21_14_0_10_41_12]PIV46809.1 MAG: hypothetical protein COS21_03360 [bacterium (Candidatus Gribaldobacteria) CG02_land_8_20_14_3_00_41_15]PIX02944.1 MAG: hypothetical protein COZ78_03015 [bacterium (Candidatus Gribaldobacteria) CG_4_8_14_3_um_filter_42_11]PJA01644.1 MAG: hypothetical protein COX74_01645 [b
MNIADIKKLVSEEGKIVVVSESGEVVLVAMNFDEYKKMKSRKCQEEISFDPETIIGPIMEEFNEPASQPPFTEPAIAQEKELTVEDLPF